MPKVTFRNTILLVYVLVNCFKVPRNHGNLLGGGALWEYLTNPDPVMSSKMPPVPINVITCVKSVSIDAVKVFRLVGTDQI